MARRAVYLQLSMNPSAPTPSPTSAAFVDEAVLLRLVRIDQLAGVRRSVRAALPVNVVLSIAAAIVAWNAGRVEAGLWWLSLSLAVNLLRLFLSRDVPADTGAAVERQLKIMAVSSAASGCVWALIPVLCDGYTSPQTLFYLTSVCGICAGSVVFGIAYAGVPIGFVTPALLSVAACLSYAGGFDNLSIAATVVLYLAALLRSAFLSERVFCASSRLKNAATELASQLHREHAISSDANRQLAFQASHDNLTGLLNRQGFTEATARHLAERAGQRHAVLLLDLDGFKTINDTFGHQTGDRVLEDVAAWLRTELLELEAIVCRWGGDEFLVLYTPREDQHSAAQLAQTLIASFASRSMHSAAILGLSVGVVLFDEADVGDSITFADEALYEAKHAGRNNFRVFDEVLKERSDRRRDVERDLRRAIQAGDVTLMYQPIVRIDDRQIHSLEALVRWTHPSHGPVPPEEVIHAAAATGLAEMLLRHILDEVFSALRVLEAAGPRFADVPIAVNISPREMVQLPVDDIVLGMLGRRGIAPRLLQIEITEEIALDFHATQARLNALAAADIAIVVDDFGVGYSSIASLRSSYVRRVKIDRSFVSGLSGPSRNAALVAFTVQVGHALGIEVVAEGVECEEELNVLRSLGCNLVQGYHLARPETLETLISSPAIRYASIADSSPR